MTFSPKRALAQADRVLTGLQAWNEVIAQAARWHRFPDWDTAKAWFQTIPRTPPSIREQQAWLAEQRAAAGLHDGTPIIPAERALQIAMAALERPQVKGSTSLDEFLLAHAGGLTDGALAERFVIKLSTVTRRRRALGLGPNTGKPLAAAQ